MKKMNLSGKISLSKVVMTFVAVGLIGGVVLLQQNAEHANKVKTVLARIEELQSAVTEFQKRYGYLPGDIPASLAAQLHFTFREGLAGRADGNGKVEGVSYITKQPSGVLQTGEPFFFWEDLSASFLISDQFSTAIDGEPETTITTIDQYLPSARIGKGNYFYVYSHNNKNYFGLSRVTQINPSGELESKPGMTVEEAYEINKKIDDEYPLTGRVTAKYVDRNMQWSPSAKVASPSTCYDTTTKEFSISQNHGMGVNCAISIELATN